MNIALCSSMSFYRQVMETADRLKELGHTPLPPWGAIRMREENDFDPVRYKERHYGQNIEHGKLRAINRHFAEIEKADAILVVNYPKHGYEGYIGGNVLMEMGLGLYLRKPIFMLSQIDPKLPLRDEVYALHPTVIEGNFEIFDS